MAKILFIKANDARKRVQLGVEDAERGTLVLTLKESTYASIGCPERGDEIDEGDLADLLLEDEVFRCSSKALALIAGLDRSRYELKMKLRQAGFSADATEIALDKCEKYGYLDEMRQLERLVEREANRKLRGRYYIRRMLVSKGYRSSEIDRVTSMLVNRGEIDFEANFDMLAKKRGVTDEEKLRALRYRYGYEN